MERGGDDADTATKETTLLGKVKGMLPGMTKSQAGAHAFPWADPRVLAPRPSLGHGGSSRHAARSVPLSAANVLAALHTVSHMLCAGYLLSFMSTMNVLSSPSGQNLPSFLPR